MLRRFMANRAAVVGAAIVMLFAAVAAIGPAAVPHDPLTQDLARNYESSTWDHPLGTDHLGRDNLSRLIAGARVSLGISVVSVAIGLMAGLIFGLLAAYCGGFVDKIVARWIDILLAFPDILLAIAIIAFLGKGIGNTVVAVAVFSVPTFARIVRASALSVLSLDYIHACRAAGAPAWRIVLRHIVPNCLSPIVVQSTLMLGTAILMASGLSFLGLGVQPPDPEWGAMLSKGRELVRSEPIGAVAPGIAITLLVLSFSLVGDGLRDALDPHAGSG